MKVTHPLLKYHGSKWRIAPWIINHFPKHRIYVEPFGGSGSVLLRKEKSDVEVYNDLDGEIVNLFWVCREHGEELSRKVFFTPYSRDEFIKSFDKTDDPIEQARRTVIRAFQGWGSGYATFTDGGKSAKPKNAFRVGWRCRGNKPHTNWCHVSNTVMQCVERLREVIIEQTAFKDVIKKNDTRDTLIYADPPYISSSRDKGNDYRFELTEADHIELARILHNTAGSVVISGYNSDLYNTLYKGWTIKTIETRTAQNKKRIEVLWIRGNK